VSAREVRELGSRTSDSTGGSGHEYAAPEKRSSSLDGP
jgi:hypothetical protein